MNKLLRANIASFGLLTGAFAAAVQEPSSADIAFFESKIRPILVEHCYKCHAADSEKIRGRFLIDSAPALLRGGESGLAIVPGNSQESRLIQMVKRHPDFEAMPPKSKLSQEDIENLVAWIDRGAPDPRLNESVSASSLSDFNLEERKKWWSLQPIANPAAPQVKNDAWPHNDYDRFVLAKLEGKGWVPAEEADRRTLLRRLSFDLIGLAPTAEELDAFLADNSPDAYVKQVDRLLASPHFGEKWARHWLDLVRYAETKAFEQDYTMAHAYRYRDYVINALNEDVPYNQFILESLAGDLLENPRMNPKDGYNESVMGPGYIYLTDGQHGPPDLHEDEARVFDGMIDVTSKAFLGSTLACARCHNHKFDAITAGDYYSFYGMLRSSRLSYTNTVGLEQQKAPLEELTRKKRDLRKLAFDASREDVDNLERYLQTSKDLADSSAVKEIVERFKKDIENSKQLKNKGPKVLAERLRVVSDAAAAKRNLRAEIFNKWLYLASYPPARHPYPELAQLFDKGAKNQSVSPASLSETFAAVSRNLADWVPQGLAFRDTPMAPGEIIYTARGDSAIQSVVGDDPLAGSLSGRVTGALRSPDFIIDGKPIELYAKGNAGTIRLVIRNYELSGRGPTTSSLYKAVNGGAWQKIRFETYLWEGEPAYLEIAHNNESNHSIHPRKGPYNDLSDDAFISFRFGEGFDWNEFWSSDLTGAESPKAVAQTVRGIWARGRKGNLSNEEADLLGAFFNSGLIESDTSRSSSFKQALDDYRELALSIPEPRFARSLVDGIQHDEPVYIRGSHNNLSNDPNPRRFFDAFGGKELSGAGSGRLEWAQEVASPENPLTVRVQVNRIWKHLFGAGLVETTNDFGQMGKTPTHPELLDRLANDFIDNGWSIKTAIRQLVLTRTYRMSSTPSEIALREDPNNALLQRMPIRRLDAELIRDHILFSSGELNTIKLGPSVPAFVDDLPDSRARPETGPLDGDGRRSIYLEQRRNYLSTFLRAFDMPNATESIGKRNVTNVPAQSLALMNDPFVHQQSTAWANRILKTQSDLDERIHNLHITAFSRPATRQELDWAKRFLVQLSADYNVDEEDPTVWSDLCHMIYNRKEFIYIF